ncbi:MAG: aminotransferase class V-fold PLP-dependent enzyme [Pseudanabaena sp. ELA607]
MTQRPIYLDSHATTPVDLRVLEAMYPYFREQFGNPSSGGHVYGWEAAAAVEQARATIAAAIGADPTEIIFTSGATEANNLALKGAAEAAYGQKQHIITVVTEHNAILDPCRYLASLGFAVTYLAVDGQGLIDLGALVAAFRPDTLLVSVMAANNEIGVIQPLAAIGALCHERGVYFHCDAAQALTKMPIQVQEMQIDLLSLTAHKIYGPKGIGALYVRRRKSNHGLRVNLAPQLHGGGHEKGLRSGTLYTPQIVGFGAAVALGLELMPTEQLYLQGLRDQLWSKLQVLPEIYLNGHPSQRLAGNLNLSVGGVDGAALHLGLRSVVAVSAGSACSSGNVGDTAPSHVLKAIGRSDSLARASIRFGLGRDTTESEIERVVSHSINVIQRLRQSR